MSDDLVDPKFVWIPKDVRGFYPYVVNVATKRVVTCDRSIFTEDDSRELWERIVKVYESPRLYLKHITEAYFEAQEIRKRTGGAVAYANEYMEIKEDALVLAKKIINKKRLDWMYVNDNPVRVTERYESLVGLFNGDEYLAEEALSEGLDSLRVSRVLEYVAHESEKMSKNVKIIHTFAKEESNAFSSLIFRDLDGERGDEYKIINLSVLAIYGKKEFNASKILSQQGKL